MASDTVVPLVRRKRSGPSSTLAVPQALGEVMRDLSAPPFSYVGGITPVVREPYDTSILQYRAAAATTLDAIQRSGWLAGGIQQAKVQMIGTGLAINLKPKLGIIGNLDETETWAREVEAHWEDYARDAWSVDFTGRHTLGQIADQALSQYFATGEIVGLLPFEERVGSSHGTKVHLLPSSRLMDDAIRSPEGVVQGIKLNRRTLVPEAYVFNNRNPWDVTGQEITVKARDENGRPQVIHLFENGPGALRGVSPLLPALKVAKQYDQLADATLTAALVQTIMAATIESDSPTEELLKALQTGEEQEDDSVRAEADVGTMPGDFERLMAARLQWYSNTKVDLGQFGKLVHLFPNEKLNMNRSEHPNTNYLDFSKGLLREIARCIGITYEQFTGDYIGATYSSVRMASADMWLVNVFRRAHFAGRFYQTAFERWLEEDIEKGHTAFPGGVPNFLIMRAEVCRVDWRGPPKPTADDLKTAKAQQIQRQEGWVPTEQLSAEYGNDHRDVIESQRRTDDLRKENKLPPLGSGEKPSPFGGGGGGDGKGGGPPPAGPPSAETDAALVAALIANDDEAVDKLLMEEYGVAREPA